MISMFSRAHVVSYDLQGTDPHCATSFPDPHRRSSPTTRGKSASHRRRVRTTNLRRLSLMGPSGREKGRRTRAAPGAPAEPSPRSTREQKKKKEKKLQLLYKVINLCKNVSFLSMDMFYTVYHASSSSKTKRKTGIFSCYQFCFNLKAREARRTAKELLTVGEMFRCLAINRFVASSLKLLNGLENTGPLDYLTMFDV